MSLSGALDLCITFRCNAACPNCIKFCGLDRFTGLVGSETDMTLAQVRHAVAQWRAAARRPVWDVVTVTGGEALVHPDLEAIMREVLPLAGEGVVGGVQINSNLRQPYPEWLESHIVNYTTPSRHRHTHKAALWHPHEWGASPTYETCQHYRKHTVSLSYLGYALCCAGESYARLVGREDAFMHELPESVDSWPREVVDAVCGHCPFGDEEHQPFEFEVGRPVSDTYRQFASFNRSWGTIRTRFPEEQA